METYGNSEYVHSIARFNDGNVCYWCLCSSINIEPFAQTQKSLDMIPGSFFFAHLADA
jgi:hypothetical protein